MMILIGMASACYAIGIISLLRLGDERTRISFLGWSNILGFAFLLGAAHLKFGLLRFSLKLDLIFFIYVVGMITTLTIIGHTQSVLGRKND
ncbi:MAG: hypothetical protein O3A01_03150 [bacterium]|nr:hypothetical protein [bacterium]